MTAQSPEGAFAEEEEASSDPLPPMHDAKMVDEIIEWVKSTNRKWMAPADPIIVGSKTWKPSLIREDKPAVLHVHVSATMPRWIKLRLEEAARNHQVYVAMTLEGLYDEEVLKVLSDIDADVFVFGDSSDGKPAYYLAALADRSIPVTDALGRELAMHCWEQRRKGSSYDKGRHFEGLLAFMLSRINGFRIYERNFNMGTDEIDIVVRVDAFTEACWSESGVPFVIIEAKNRDETVGSAVVTVLIRKLETRRGRARIGILFTTSSFSPEAQAEELKEAKGNLVVAMLGPSEIVEWIDAPDLTEYLDRQIGRAMLR
jgi:Holliday junction resolvase-like predicted endonuclease